MSTPKQEKNETSHNSSKNNIKEQTTTETTKSGNSSSNLQSSWFFAPINPSSLALFRIIFGVFYLRYFYNLYTSGWLQNSFAPNVYHFKWPYFEWLPDLSTPHIYILWGVTMLGIILFVLGLLYRGATIVVLCGSLYFFLIDQAAYIEKNYFFLCLLVLFLCTDANATFSLDNFLLYKNQQPNVPTWHLLAFLCQISLVHFYSGLAKVLTEDWVQRGEPLLTWLFLGSPNHPVISFPAIASVAEDLTMKNLSLWIGYFQIVSEMFGAVWPWFGRFFPPIRILSLTALVLDHLFTLVAFGLGDPYFWILILSCFLWINPIFSQGVLNTFLMTHLFDFKRKNNNTSNKKKDHQRLVSIFKRLNVWIVVIFLIIQLVVPLRPYLSVWQYNTTQLDPNWSKEGYYFSWRERLVDEDTLVRWEAHELGSRYNIPGLTSDTVPYVTLTQRNILKNDPNMIIRFGQSVIPTAMQEKNIFPENVTVDCWHSLNGRPYQRWINNSVNLLEYSEHSSLPILLPRIPDFETESFFQEMRTVRDKWLQRKYECVFFGDRPGGTFQAKFHEFAFTLMLITVRGEIEVEVTDPNNPVAEPDVEILQSGGRMELPFRAWHTIRVISKEPACWAYLYSFPNSLPFYLAIEM